MQTTYPMATQVGAVPQGYPEGYAPVYGATAQGDENSKLMATAVAGTVMETAKEKAKQIKNVILNMKEGPASIRVLSAIAGGALLVSGFFTFFGHVFALRPISALVKLYMSLFGLMILLVEGYIRLLPQHYIDFIHTYFAFVTVVWGRGAFFFFVGTLAVAQWSPFDIVLGGYLMLLGLFMIFWGQQAYKMLDAVRLQMRDPKVVEGLFYRFDENRNGFLEKDELKRLLASLGAQLRQVEVEAAIIIMDKDNDGKVSLQEFQAWWMQQNPMSVVEPAPMVSPI